MRIISGKRRGLKLLSPPGDKTRPTTDRVKESLFNIIQMRFPCGSVLDLFSGSGALGIEALSRGAEKAVFVELDKDAYEVTRKNLAAGGFLENAVLLRNNSLDFLSGCSEEFDVIFLDPPYNKGLLTKALKIIYERGLLKENGIIAAETEAGGEEASHPGFEIIKSARYGKTVVTVMQR